MTSTSTITSPKITKMPPKKTTNSTVYIVTNNSNVEGVFATNAAAESRAGEFKSGKVVKQALVGGSITVTVTAEEKPAKPVKKTKNIKNEDEEDEEDVKDEKTSAPAKKTKSPEEQRAANAKKTTKFENDDLPGYSSST